MTFTRKEFADLVHGANAGDPAAIARLRRTLDENPELWQQLGDLAAHAEAALITLVAGNEQLARESILRKLHAIRMELAGPSPTLLESMAVERVVTAWLLVQYTDTLLGGSTNASPGRASQIFKWQTRTAHRYNAAVKALLDLRRLLPQTLRSDGPNGRTPTDRPSLRVVGSNVDSGKNLGTGTFG